MRDELRAAGCLGRGLAQETGGAGATNVARSTESFWAAFTPRAKALREACGAALAQQPPPEAAAVEAAHARWSAEADALQALLNEKLHSPLQ